jgi:hypothetical protein
VSTHVQAQALPRRGVVMRTEEDFDEAVSLPFGCSEKILKHGSMCSFFARIFLADGATFG